MKDASACEHYRHIVSPLYRPQETGAAFSLCTEADRAPRGLED